MIHPINIKGKFINGVLSGEDAIPIGKFEEAGAMQGINLLDVITQVKAAPAGTRILQVHIASPGGLVEEGDNIHDYLESLQRDYIVNTIQDGPVASIATKIWSVGRDRKADPRHPFLIHNPWNDPGPGDANYQAENLEILLAEEDKLRKFYSKKFNISEEGLKPLMDQETTIPAAQLLALGIATSIKPNVKVMAQVKPDKKSEPLAARLMAAYKALTGKDLKAAEPVKGLDLQLADGSGMLTVDAANEDSLVGAAATLNGQPAPDADYPIAPDASGMSDVVTVVGGKVTAVAEQQPAGAIGPLPAALAKQVKDLTEIVASLVASVHEMSEAQKAATTEATTAATAEVEKKFEAKLVALKTDIGTTHEPRKPAVVYASTVSKEQTAFKNIGERMLEKQEARKAKLNKN